ncbi:transcriptional regulator, AsnC family [Cutibacterium modestum HL037PA2]|uniref:Transcriptional regulator, AsnC family n=1 Tax=Cutibacterium modestum HL044PA1 TaxID=765109 RepID=A0ABP2K9W6_9ACTN|nr:transcriptional regulator, AsnC family [Cutibacterium modestum HL037PA2]EFS92862.1 transcriptional regulator, AsnC family [Cutibacterium modestum HL044PA1]
MSESQPANAAIVEVDCHTESLPQVIKTLCANPMIVSVDETTGDRDLLLTVVAPDLPTLSDMVIDWIGGLRGVHGSHSALVTSVVIDSDSWRIDALSKTEKTLARGPDQESCGCYLPTTWTGSWLGCLLSMDVLAPPHLLVLSTSPLALCIAGCRSC